MSNTTITGYSSPELRITKCFEGTIQVGDDFADLDLFDYVTVVPVAIVVQVIDHNGDLLKCEKVTDLTQIFPRGFHTQPVFDGLLRTQAEIAFGIENCSSPILSDSSLFWGTLNSGQLIYKHDVQASGGNWGVFIYILGHTRTAQGLMGNVGLATVEAKLDDLIASNGGLVASLGGIQSDLNVNHNSTTENLGVIKAYLQEAVGSLSSSDNKLTGIDDGLGALQTTLGTVAQSVESQGNANVNAIEAVQSSISNGLQTSLNEINDNTLPISQIEGNTNGLKAAVDSVGSNVDDQGNNLSDVIDTLMSAGDTNAGIQQTQMNALTTAVENGSGGGGGVVVIPPGEYPHKD